MKFVLPAILIVFPLFAFCFAAITELRSSESPWKKSLALAPIVFGLVVYGFAWGPFRLLHIPFASPVGGRMMAMFSALVACSGAFVGYSRRRSSVLIALGGLELMFVYIFFNEPIV